MELSTKDKQYLVGVHPHLAKVIYEAARISPIKFKLTCGLRTVAEQKELVAKGASKTMKSRHLSGHAVDLVPLVDKNNDGKISTEEMYDWPAYHQLAVHIKQAAKNVGVRIEWGGDWVKFKDGPHWQLPWANYPAGASFADMDGEPTDYETESQSKVKEVTAIGAAGIGGAGASVADVADTLIMQQGELTSGSFIRIAVAAVIVGLTVYTIVRKLRK